MTDQGFQPEISTIRAYFPGDPRAFHAEIQQISKETDLATIRVDMQDLKRSVLIVDWGQGAAVTGPAYNFDGLRHRTRRNSGAHG